MKKKVVGDDTDAPKKPQWVIPHAPVILALLFIDHDDRGSARLEQFVVGGI